jgi:hypothetical protein
VKASSQSPGRSACTWHGVGIELAGVDADAVLQRQKPAGGDLALMVGRQHETAQF